uniref:Holin n=1 Tax=Micrococcus phage Kurnik TaxID=3092208 RepID=A0AAU6R5E2_9CAUD
MIRTLLAFLLISLGILTFLLVAFDGIWNTADFIGIAMTITGLALLRRKS